MSVGVVVDSACDLNPKFAKSRGVVVVPLHMMFPQGAMRDDPSDRSKLYDLLEEAETPPACLGIPNRVMYEVFQDALEEWDELLFLSMPFQNVSLGNQAGGAAGRVKRGGVEIIRPGRGFASLGALSMVLGGLAMRGAARPELVEFIEKRSMDADCLMAPASTDCLRRTMKLTLIESKLGPLADAVPILRVHTQLSGVERSPDQPAAMARMVQLAKSSRGTEPLVVVVGHADAPAAARKLAALAAAELNASELVTVEIGPVAGAYVGRGAVSLGWCPDA